MESVEVEITENHYQSTKLVVLQGVMYTILQMSLFFLPIDPYVDYYNHINWGIGFADGQIPYRDFSGNEYPVLSAYGWIIAYQLSPKKTYIWLSIVMNFPYWILSIFGGICLYRLLVDVEIRDKNALYIVSFFFYLPLNLIDTLNNHGSLGTASTVIISIYFWYRNQYFWSAAFLSAGFSIKLYPIFIAPFLTLEITTMIGKIKYGSYLMFWTILFHLPVLIILPDYFEVLFWRTSNRGGITYSKIIEVILNPIGIEVLPTLIWLLILAMTAFILLYETNLHQLHKFGIITMVNNLFEPRGGIGHIVTVLPIIAIYFIVITKNRSEKLFFWVYIVLSTFWGFDRIMFNFKEGDTIIETVFITYMIIGTTIIFLLYISGLYRNKQLNFTLLDKNRQ